VVALGLLAIGIPYAPLWGFVAAMLRFVPFVGTSLAMLFPRRSHSCSSRAGGRCWRRCASSSDSTS